MSFTPQFIVASLPTPDTVAVAWSKFNSNLQSLQTIFPSFSPEELILGDYPDSIMIVWNKINSNFKALAFLIIGFNPSYIDTSYSEVDCGLVVDEFTELIDCGSIIDNDSPLLYDGGDVLMGYIPGYVGHDTLLVSVQKININMSMLQGVLT